MKAFTDQITAVLSAWPHRGMGPTEIAIRIGLPYRGGAARVMPALKDMLDEGLVTKVGTGRKTVYRWATQFTS